jgi:PAS domain S-box-containing protein
MNKKALNILLIEDNPGDARLIREMLEEVKVLRFSLVHSGTFSGGCEELGRHEFDVILLDLGLPDSSGLEVIYEVKKTAPDSAIVILTGLDDEESALLSLQMGAQDYLVKGRLDSSLLVRSLRYAIERKQAEVLLTKAKDDLEVRVRQRTADLLIANETISASNALLKLYSRTFSREEYLDSVLELVGKWSACRSFGISGIRILDDKGNMPYASYKGFSSEFCKQEAAVSVNNDICICARVIKEKPEQQELSFISPGGSFYCNNFVEFVTSLKKEEKNSYRSGCIQSGFISMAIIPIRYQNRVVGVFHLADKIGGKASLKCIEFMDSMMLLVGEAVHRYRVEEDRARLTAAAESAIDAIVITDTEGKVQYMNPAFEHITCYSREEVIGRDLHFLDSGRHDEAFYMSIRETVRQGKVWTGLMVSKKKDGALYQEDLTIAPVKDYAGRISNYTMIRRDVTDKLRFESIAEAVNTMNNIGYVFSGIRHEIGNPINSIKITLTLLKSNMDYYSKETIQTYIGRILDEVLRIEYLLKNLKTFNMYETPELRDISIQDFLEKFLLLSKTDYEKKGIAITTSMEPGAEFCHTDPRALQQVLLNLFTNSVDACEARPGPRISIAVSKASGMIRMRISDNGCGMTEEQHRNMFKPFYTTKSDGTGLGLVIAKKMLAKMDSSIEVTSRVNEGTEVSIFMPEGKSENR